MVAKVVDVVAFFHRVRDVLVLLIRARAGVEHSPHPLHPIRLEIPLDFLGLGGSGDSVRPVASGFGKGKANAGRYSALRPAPGGHEKAPERRPGLLVVLRFNRSRYPPSVARLSRRKGTGW